MKKYRRASRKERSGQLLIITALAIAILISSTSIYIYELSKESNSQSSLPIANFIPIIKQCTKNALISSLANISNGGSKTVLATNLDELSEILRSLRQPAIFQLMFDLLNNSDYEFGVRLSYGEGFGISSAYANFTVNIQGLKNVELEYASNITTKVLVEGYYIRNGDEKNVTLTCKVYNEGEPALARKISLFYELGGIWVPVTPLDNLSTVDFGDGTYVLSFTTISSSENIQVSAHVYDLRGIFVYANTTCTEA
jgi:hypothetical protein